MDRYLSRRLFAADFSARTQRTRPSYRLTTAEEVKFKEDWLREAIVADPDLVIEPCREAGLTEESWRFWQEEFSVDEAGCIDVLLVSDQGRIAIVETKLSYNPGSRRSVVAQTLEYAIHLREIPESRVRDLPKLGKREFVERDQVLSALRLGDFLLIVAGDQLDSRAVKLSKTLLGKHLLQNWQLAMVEVAVYEREKGATGPRHLLVPHIRGAIVPEQRQVVHVVVEGAAKVTMRVEQDHGSSDSGIRKMQDVDTFRRELPEALKGFFDKLLGLTKTYTRFTCTPSKTALIFRHDEANILELYSWGDMKVRPYFFGKAFGSTVARTYSGRLRQLMPRTFSNYAYGELDEQKAVRLLQIIRQALATAAKAKGDTAR